MRCRGLHMILIAVLVAAQGAMAQLNTDRIIQVGRNALYFQDYMLAIRHFNRVIDNRPYLAEPYYLRAIAKYNLEDYAGALTDASAAVELNPFLPDAWEVRGVANHCLENYAAAVSDYSRALDLLPYNRQILFNKAVAQERAGMYADADSTYAALFRAYPRFDAARVGHAQLNLQRGDTLAARADLGAALEINPNSVEALTLRASLSADDPKAALADMERAVKIQPDRAYLRVNRAVARYLNFDFNGALDDFDYVLQQDPMNYTALFNRAMIRAEIKDNDRALQDLDLALKLRPDDVRAKFNRALILSEKHQWDDALADADAVVAAYPEMFAGYALRAQINRQAGRESAAAADYRRSMQIARRDVAPDASGASDGMAPDADADAADRTAATINRFKTLQTIQDESATAQTFNAEGLRARVEERHDAIEPQPIYQLSYYTADADDESAVFDREINAINSARMLPFVVFLTNNLPQMTLDSDASRHFEDIQRLGALVNAGNASPLDYFARAMDYMTLKDYTPAIADLDALLAARPDFAPGYLMRAAARYRLMESQRGRVMIGADAAALNSGLAMDAARIRSDLDMALNYNPAMAVAVYNKGVLAMQAGDYDEASADFTRAISLNPDLGAAYFNRGFIHFSRGNRDDAERDVSRAGQLGVRAAYSLLRRMKE